MQADNNTGLSADELEAETVTALPDKEVVSILDLNADLDLAIDAAAPIDLAVAANANVAAPIDAAVLIGCSAHLRESLAVVTGRGIPVVVIEGDAGGGIPRIDLDNREAQRQLASHIRSLGLPSDSTRSS